MTRKPIKYRNALTELWNDGRSIPEISLFTGLTEARVHEMLAANRKGFNTPAEMNAAADAAAERKEARKTK